VAVTVRLPSADGAVNSPVALIAPSVELHVTAELKLPVPCTVAVHCEVASGAIVEGAQATDTDVIVGEEVADCTVTESTPDFDVSCVLVAVTVTLPDEAGAVKRPLELTVPPLEDHFSAEL